MFHAQQSVLRPGESYPAIIGTEPGAVGVELTTINK